MLEHSVFSVSVTCRIILGADHQTSTLLRTSVYRLEDIDELLLVFKDPVELIVIAGSEIAHHMLYRRQPNIAHYTDAHRESIPYSAKRT
jgi:hypothetical protein